MNDIFNIIHSYGTHPLTFAGLILLLSLYRFLAKRSLALPQIPLGLVIAYLFLELMLTLLKPYDIGKLENYLQIATTVVLYCVVVRFAIAGIFDLWFARMRKAPLPKITTDFIMAVFIIVIILWVLRSVGGIDLASLLTTSAILTAVLGLALQDTLGSFFAGLSLQLERPYQIGDWVMLNGHEGKIIGINWRTTRVLTRFDEVVYIPNNVITRESIKNFSQPDASQIVRIDVGIEYGAAPNKVRGVLLSVLNTHGSVAKDFASTVRLVDFDEYSIKYAVVTRINDLDNINLVIADIKNQMWYALKRSGIKIPYPIRDVNVKQIDEARDRDETVRSIETALKKIPILKPLSDADFKELSTGVVVEQYGTGEDVVCEGALGDTMYLIQEGVCDVMVIGSEGISKKVATLSKGNFFGEMSLLTGDRRTATVRANGDARLLSIGKKAFAEILEKHPEISVGLAEALAERKAELDQIKNEKTAVEATAKTFLQKIKGFFGI